MQINPTARRGAARRVEIAHLRSNAAAAIPFPGCFAARRADGENASPPPTPADARRRCQRAAHENAPPGYVIATARTGAMRPTLQPSVHYRIQRVRRDPEYRVPSSLRDPPRGVTHPGATRTRLCSPTRVRSLADRPTIVISPLSPLSLSLSLCVCAVSGNGGMRAIPVAGCVDVVSPRTSLFS